MQVTKGGFVGKSFALKAKLNDSSGGKKSKRRSKQERKGMIETFIKRHQESNNGNFPSLHLTHKEVGGSYYTVREIFRELIQENRVLAPPKLSPGDKNMENLDSFLDNNPLGSISFDPNVHGLPSKHNQTLLNEYEIRREKVLNSRRISELHRRNLDHDDDVKEVVVESFPLRHVSSTINNVDEETCEKEVADNLSELLDAKLESAYENIVLKDKASSTLDNISYQHLHTATKSKSGIQPSDTENQTDFASLEAEASYKSDSRENNLFVSFIKTCVNAFMKLWSE